MNVQLRQFFGMFCLIGVTVIVSWLITAPSRNRLVSAQSAITQLGENKADLTQRMEVIGAVKSNTGKLPPSLLWAGTDDASIEIAQQQALVAIANESGLRILSFGATQGPEKLGHTTRAYELEVEGGHAEVAQLIAGIERLQPRLAISYLWLRQIPAAEGQIVAPVNMRLAMWGFSVTRQVKP